MPECVDSIPECRHLWGQAQTVFSDALSIPLAQREEFLKRACADHPSLFRYVEVLLRNYDSASSFLDKPVGSIAPQTSGDPLFKAGQVLAERFSIERSIGRGGMGEVYAAVDIELHEPVAVKVLRPQVAANAETVELLKRETQTARRVTHTNVCRTFDFYRHHDGAASGVYFVTMELLVGETLADHLHANGVLKTADVFPFLEQIVAGLDAAHKAGVIHRDLKPGNIILTPGTDGTRRAVITDFGLAIIRAPNTTHDSATEPVGGTPRYMAPEQFVSTDITQAVDIYALGVVLHEMLTGLPVFDRNGVSQFVRASSHLAVSPDRRKIPRRWADAIVCCVDPAPGRRFQDAKELLEAVRPRAGIGRRVAVSVGLAAVAGLALWKSRTVVRPGGTRNRDADAAYQRGRLHAKRNQKEESIKALRAFEQALTLDPSFALAHAGIAETYSSLADYGGIPYRQAGAKAFEHARRAVQIAPDSAETNAALGRVLSLDLDRWRTCEPAFLRARRLDPDYGPARQWYAAYLAISGRTKDAIEETRLALRSDPVSLPINGVLGWMLYFDRQFSSAAKQALATIDLDPNYLHGYLLLARSCVGMNRVDDAFQACERATQIAKATNPGADLPTVLQSAHACVLAAAGDKERARATARILQELRKTEHVPVHYLATIYSLLLENDAAFSWIDQGISDGDPGVLFLVVYPQFDPIRADPRYADCLRRLHLTHPLSARVTGDGGSSPPPVSAH
jgi:tetratricopeptide (TPR) repeat protein